MRTRIDASSKSIHPRPSVYRSNFPSSTKLPIEDTHSIDKNTRSMSHGIDRSSFFVLLPLQEGTLLLTRETSLPLKKHKNDESRTVNVPHPLCINHHHPSRTVEKKKKRNLTPNRCETAIDGSRSIGIFTHQTYRSIKIPIECGHKKRKRKRVWKGTESEWNAARDDDARARLLTTTHGRNDAMAKYYGDIAKAAKGTFAGSDRSMKTRM